MPQNTKPFVDRKEAIDLFERFIDFEKPIKKPFLNFYGMSGIGKSFLIDYLTETYLHNIAFIHISFEPGAGDYDYNFIINQIIRVLRPKTDAAESFRQFKEKRDQWLDESKKQINRIENTILASGGSTIDIGTSSQNVTLEKLRTETRHRITQAFFDALDKIAPGPLLIILDAIENLLPETGIEKETPDYAGWLINFLLQIADIMPTARVMLSGRNHIRYDSLNTKCNFWELLHLPSDDVVDYLQQLGIKDEDLISAIYGITNGYSLSVAMAGELWIESKGSLCEEDLTTEEFTHAYNNKLVPELLMRRIMDRADDHIKPMIKYAGFFRYFTYQVLKETLIPDLREEDFQRFIKYSFISKTGRHYQYHAELRRLVTGNYLEQDSKNFRRDHETIYQYFNNQESIEKDNDRRNHDEQFYYGIYGQVEGVFEEWENTCYRYYNTWQTENLKLILDMIDEIQQLFSDKQKSDIYSAKGKLFERYYEWDKALEHYFKSEQILIDVGDKAGLGTTYNNIGLIYYQQNDKTAIRYIDRSVAIFTKLGASHELEIAEQRQNDIHKKFD
jgi:hypothetical protein